MREISREGCGALNCIHNVRFRCMRKTIMVDEGSKCHSIREYCYRFGVEK